MTDVAGGDDCLARSGDASDLNVADFDRLSEFPLPGSDFRRGFRRSPVERQHPAAEYILDGAFEGVMEVIAPAAGGQKS